eukprot:Gb_36736 [translate_table: standard]
MELKQEMETIYTSKGVAMESKEELETVYAPQKAAGESKQEIENVSGLQQSTMESKQEVETVSALQDATVKPKDGTCVNSVKDIESLKGEVTSLKSRIMELEGRLKVNEASVGISVLYLQSVEDIHHQILFLEMVFVIIKEKGTCYADYQKQALEDLSARLKTFMNLLKSVWSRMVGVFGACVTGKDDDFEDVQISATGHILLEVTSRNAKFQDVKGEGASGVLVDDTNLVIKVIIHKLEKNGKGGALEKYGRRPILHLRGGRSKGSSLLEGRGLGHLRGINRFSLEGALGNLSRGNNDPLKR